MKHASKVLRTDRRLWCLHVNDWFSVHAVTQSGIMLCSLHHAGQTRALEI